MWPKRARRSALFGSVRVLNGADVALSTNPIPTPRAEECGEPSDHAEGGDEQSMTLWRLRRGIGDWEKSGRSGSDSTGNGQCMHVDNPASPRLVHENHPLGYEQLGRRIGTCHDRLLHAWTLGDCFASQRAAAGCGSWPRFARGHRSAAPGGDWL